MPRRLYVILPEPGEQIDCAIAEGGNIKLVSGDRVPTQPKDEVIVLVPGTEVGCHTVSLPSQPAEQLRRSAAYALEDEIAVPVEDVHVAVGQPSGSAAARPAFVVDTSLMQGWVDQLRTLNLANARLVPDVSLLPAADMVVESRRHVLFGGERSQSPGRRRQHRSVVAAVGVAGTWPGGDG